MRGGRHSGRIEMILPKYNEWRGSYVDIERRVGRTSILLHPAETVLEFGPFSKYCIISLITSL